MKKKEILLKLNSMMNNTLMETLDIQFTDIGDDYLVATMPVNEKVYQPMGLLHGGASVALAESVGSTASHFFIDSEKFEVRGIEITANHLKSKRDGIVTATARMIHKGKTTHLWEIRIVDEEGKLISLCKLTNIILSKK
ncbi:MAG: hotdog fold thioesterase [Flavobacteriaceae bacterium]|nr:hotdog fold thioesterase [Flavobacteriaceae bacterium]